LPLLVSLFLFLLSPLAWLACQHSYAKLKAWAMVSVAAWA
jgi:hypothetical protein